MFIINNTEIYDMKEAAEKLKISVKSLFYYVGKLEIPIQEGYINMYALNSIKAYINERKATKEPKPYIRPEKREKLNRCQTSYVERRGKCYVWN